MCLLRKLEAGPLLSGQLHSGWPSAPFASLARNLCAISSLPRGTRQPRTRGGLIEKTPTPQDLRVQAEGPAFSPSAVII